MTRRFRLDSATSVEAWFLANRAYRRAGFRAGFQRGRRAARLLLHWWALGHDPARALRCPECHGDGQVWDEQICEQCFNLHQHDCPDCQGRGWSMPHERGTR